MDYYQGVVIEYLRADRSVFVNTECLVQLDEADNPDKTRHWYCDALAVDFRTKTIWLCETSYSKTLGTLLRRLADWNTHWLQIRESLVRDCKVPDDFAVRPWLFIQSNAIPLAVKKLSSIGTAQGHAWHLPDPRITPLESVTPWTHCTWNQKGECAKPDSVPASMRE